ncbi:MAG: hypothetical protein L0Z53_04400 [Acidobacteriales bacterium]|nr:hypothetical protein [Terriglobales bacterium]
MSTVYVYLLDEGVDCWRPVQADKVGENLYRIRGPVPEGERWEFQPDDVVRAVIRKLSDGPTLVAIEKMP